MTVSQAESLWLGVSELITLMLHDGFVAVSLVDHGRYKEWDEQDPKQVMTRIRNEWVRLKGKFPDVGYIVWFHKVDQKPSWNRSEPSA